MTAKYWFDLSMFLVGTVVGRLTSRWIKKKKGPNPTQPICPCGHVFGAHQDGNKCLDRVYRSGDGWRFCACTKYHGPELITNEFFNPGTHIQ